MDLKVSDCAHENMPSVSEQKFKAAAVKKNERYGQHAINFANWQNKQRFWIRMPKIELIWSLPTFFRHK